MHWRDALKLAIEFESVAHDLDRLRIGEQTTLPTIKFKIGDKEFEMAPPVHRIQ